MFLLRQFRRHPWLSLAALALAGGVIWFLVLREGPINEANYERIEAGMSAQQMERMLGKAHCTRTIAPIVVSSVDFTEHELVLDVIAEYAPADAKPALVAKVRALAEPSVDRTRILEILCWQQGDRSLCVMFDDRGRAVAACYRHPLEGPSWWARLMGWFGSW
ncbi:MAG: hypothetical protein L0Y72_31120 [Gemmataceae bacterium]|nr:hypothetical protein [Gemmataceae bacterium]MCI0743502.1 hypothetical protein [Gemmataceae bacterium]